MNDEELRLEAQAFEAAARALMNGFAGLPDHREPQDWVRISHALDGGPASSALEKEVVRQLAAMIGICR